jgi:hypothetical protein
MKSYVITVLGEQILQISLDTLCLLSQRTNKEGNTYIAYYYIMVYLFRVLSPILLGKGFRTRFTILVNMVWVAYYKNSNNSSMGKFRHF